MYIYIYIYIYICIYHKIKLNTNIANEQHTKHNNIKKQSTNKQTK